MTSRARCFMQFVASLYELLNSPTYIPTTEATLFLFNLVKAILFIDEEYLLKFVPKYNSKSALHNGKQTAKLQ